MQMAPLYKRYIPPKTSTTSVVPSATVTTDNDQTSAPNDVPKKRKRERTTEEIAERKAKKLRKKGIDPVTILDQDDTQDNVVTTAGVGNASPREDVVHKAIGKSAGEFAHIKNTKKRHKLEKEARKARKVVESGISSAGMHVEENGTLKGRNQAVDLDSEDQGQRLEGSADAGAGQTKRRGQYTAQKNHVSPDIVESRGSEEVQESKKKKKKDKSHTEQDFVELRNVHPDRSAQLEDKTDSIPAQARKRRHKLESIFNEPASKAEAEPLADDEHQQRHEGIMNKFQKSKKISQSAPKPAVNLEVEQRTERIVLDLGPLPQPERAPTPEFVPDPSALPEWLAKPTIVSSDNRVTFEELKFEPKLVQHLSKLGFRDALPVQQALIPLLLSPGTPGAQFLPGTESVLPDVAVGASTGSGKTIAYLLPMIESLKKAAALGRLRALIVVPTRELVMQVAAVTDSLARGSSIKVGTATGTGNFKDEQMKLVKKGRKYDPEAHRKLMEKAHVRNYPPARDSEEFEEYLSELENQDAREEKRIKDVVTCLVDHVPTYNSAVDILVATPGRLLDHLHGTLGFGIAYLEWLVLDEADKLIDQQYQGFLEAVNESLEEARGENEQDAREQYLRSKGCWNERRERRVRKVVLSATMTRDISKLVDLKLKRPRMILVRGQEGGPQRDIDGQGVSNGEGFGIRESNEVFELPPTLTEYCVHVGDGSEKPLNLTELLETRIIPGMKHVLSNSEDIVEHRASTDSESDAESSGSSVSAGSDADTHSASESDADTESGANEAGQLEPMGERIDLETAMHPDRVAMLDSLPLQRQPLPTRVPTILVFTSSTEAANRLSHLLKKLSPELASSVNTMTRADPKKTPFSKVKTADPIIVISTDRASRGLDAIAGRPITHVVQYDVPRSVTGYVHRVGRTARAGKSGEAWTLYTHSEARWFLHEISKAGVIKRSEVVEKVKLHLKDDGMREKLADAIAQMRDEVYARGAKPK